MIDMKTHSRIPAGRPTGGQFAYRKRDADAITLPNQFGRDDWFGVDPSYADPTAEAVVNSAMKVDLDTLLHRVETGEITKPRAAVKYWEQIGGPLVPSWMIPWEVAREASLTVNAPETGGAWSVATEYLRTGVRTTAVEALALPFSSLRGERPDDIQLAYVATLLSNRQGIANAMWDWLLDYGTCRF